MIVRTYIHTQNRGKRKRENERERGNEPVEVGPKLATKRVEHNPCPRATAAADNGGAATYITKHIINTKHQSTNSYMYIPLSLSLGVIFSLCVYVSLLGSI